jgi:hypothetical protein
VEWIPRSLPISNRSLRNEYGTGVRYWGYPAAFLWLTAKLAQSAELVVEQSRGYANTLGIEAPDNNTDGGSFAASFNKIYNTPSRNPVYYSRQSRKAYAGSCHDNLREKVGLHIPWRS